MKRLYLLALLGLLAFSGVGATPTNASFNSQVTVSGNTLSTGTWGVSSSTPPDLESVKTVLLGDSPTFYNLMSTDFQSLFSAAEFTAAMGEGAAIVSVEYLAPATQTLGSDWYEQPAKITFSDGTVTTYNLIFHLENGAWKLYATEEI